MCSPTIDLIGLPSILQSGSEKRTPSWYWLPTQKRTLTVNFAICSLFFPATYSPFFKAVYSASFLSNSYCIWLMRKEITRGILHNLKSYLSFSKRFLHQHTTLSTASRQESYPSRQQDKSGNLYRFHALELS